MTIGPAPMCFDCAHFEEFSPRMKATGTPACEAFPEGIPRDIYFDGELHLEARDGDHGIQFEAK